MADTEFPFRHYLLEMLKSIEVDSIRPHLDKASVISKSDAVVMASVGYAPGHDEMLRSEALNILSSITDSNWKLVLQLDDCLTICYEGRSFISMQQGEWKDQYKRKYWYLLFTSTSTGNDGLIIQEFDDGIVIAHCPEGVNDINRTAVSWLTSALVSEPDAQKKCRWCKCKIL